MAVKKQLEQVEEMEMSEQSQSDKITRDVIDVLYTKAFNIATKKLTSD